MATGEIRYEEATGVIDGVNTIFTTSVPFVPTTITLWYNGILVRQLDDDGFNVTGLDTFTMKRAPTVGETLHVRFREA